MLSMIVITKFTTDYNRDDENEIKETTRNYNRGGENEMKEMIQYFNSILKEM